jgi:hypothetical protein
VLIGLLSLSDLLLAEQTLTAEIAERIELGRVLGLQPRDERGQRERVSCKHVRQSLLTNFIGGGGTRSESMPRSNRNMCTSSIVLYSICNGPLSGPTIF